MERMMKTLGIDIGTTSVSLSVLDGESGEQVKAVTVGNDSFIETAEPWARLQDAEAIRHKVLEETERILSEYQDVGGIGLTGQMHGILYVDLHAGQTKEGREIGMGAQIGMNQLLHWSYASKPPFKL